MKPYDPSIPLILGIRNIKKRYKIRDQRFRNNRVPLSSVGATIWINPLISCRRLKRPVSTVCSKSPTEIRHTVLPVFTLTIFCSAYLLFLVQPMVGKMVLPHLGGTPAVWNTCMVFFQALLLAGYAYVHGSVKWLGVRRQAGIHLLIMLAPLWVLPIAINTASVPTGSDNPIVWLLLRLLMGVGLPFFVISTSAPLMQMWFSETGHASSKDPYFLYAASNFGSMIALLGYPVFVEPNLALDDQGVLWKYGYITLVVLALCCAIMMWRSSPQDNTLESSRALDTTASDEVERLGWWRQIRWVLLAFVPSSLMLGVTIHVTTEIAPVPLLWVVPLAIYLLTFVLVFAKFKILPHAIVLKALPFVLVPTVLMTVQNEALLGLLPLPLHLLSFFLVAMACHGEMAADRPSTQNLTVFYLLMSVGGVLGGIANSIVAPLIFNTLAEYPIVMVLAGFALATKPTFGSINKKIAADIVLAIVLGAATAGMLQYLAGKGSWVGYGPNVYTVVVPAAVCWVFMHRPMRYALVVGALTAATLICYEKNADQSLYAGRNFYGTKRVVINEQRTIHTFIHGATVHGVQDLRPKGADVPRTYFHPDGLVGDVFRVINRETGSKKIAVVGLGVGSMASPIYAQKSSQFTFYEIDPDVARIAANPAYFTFMDRCPNKPEVILGDGRLTIANATDHHYDAIFLDAFSSDAVPTHLLTREAVQIYASKLKEDGILVFNMSNRYLDLSPLLAGLAYDGGFECIKREDIVSDVITKKTGRFPSKFMVLSRNERVIRTLQNTENWKVPPKRDGNPIWTDKYTNVFELMTWGG